MGIVIKLKWEICSNDTGGLSCGLCATWVVMTLPQKTDPCVMRVLAAREGREAFHAEEAAQSIADHCEAAYSGNRSGCRDLHRAALQATGSQRSDVSSLTRPVWWDERLDAPARREKRCFSRLVDCISKKVLTSIDFRIFRGIDVDGRWLVLVGFGLLRFFGCGRSLVGH